MGLLLQPRESLSAEVVHRAVVFSGWDGAPAVTKDDVGNRQSQATTLGARAPGGMAAGTIEYGYDARDRMLSEALAANPATAYGWDANGNLTSKDAEATYTWDSENRLTRVAKTDGTVVEHVYDADGNRVRTTTTKPGQATEATDFLVDTSGGLSQVVAELDATAGTLKAYYVRGDDLLSVMRPDASAPSGWQTRFYHSDYIGSVRRLTDENGVVWDGYTYSAFGEQLGHSGTDPQPYAFTGEPLDPNVGWQYHRARWMDPRTGRFAGMDPWRGSTHDTATLHRYLYAGGSPVDSSDPTGRFFGGLADISIACLIRSGLSAMQANTGFAIMDQIQYGGSAGLKSLVLSTVILPVAVVAAGKLFGRLARVARAAARAGNREFDGLLTELAEFRLGVRLPAAGSADDAATIAKLEIGDMEFWGVNAHGQPVDFSVNAISKTHAETDVFQQALNEGVTARRARILIDRDLCGACGDYGGLKSLARQMGLEEVEIVAPNLKVTVPID